MLNDLNEPQRILAEYMSDLSEETYAAGWMKGLEFDLWEALEGKSKKYGRLEVNREIQDNLKRLSDGANGWIVYDDNVEEKYVSFAEWKKIRKNKNH
jgi:hypothetical protein